MKDHLDNPLLPPHGLFVFCLAARDLFIFTIQTDMEGPIDGIAHQTMSYTNPFATDIKEILSNLYWTLIMTMTSHLFQGL